MDPCKFTFCSVTIKGLKLQLLARFKISALVCVCVGSISVKLIFYVHFSKRANFAAVNDKQPFGCVTLSVLCSERPAVFVTITFMKFGSKSVYLFHIQYVSYTVVGHCWSVILLSLIIRQTKSLESLWCFMCRSTTTCSSKCCIVCISYS